MLFDENELENLNRLLGSSDASNIRLGLELLEQHPENARASLIPLVVLSQFEVSYYEEEAQANKNLAKKLLHEHTPKQLRQQHIQNLLVFKSVDEYRNLRWTEFFGQLQQFEQNIELYEPFILNNITINHIYYDLAMHLKGKYKKYGLAIGYLKKILPFNSDAARIKTDYVDILINDLFDKDLYLEEAPNVITELKDLMNYYPSFNHQYYNLIGLVYDLYVIDKEKAKAAYRESIRLNPKNCGALNNLANILFKVDQKTEEAYELVKAALKVDRKSEHYLDTKAYIELKGLNNPKKAEKTFRQIMKFCQNHHASLTGLGEALEAQGQYEEALEWYEKGLKIRKKSEFKLTKIADLLYQKLDRAEEALVYYKKIIRSYPENEYAKAMKKEIVKLLKDKK